MKEQNWLVDNDGKCVSFEVVAAAKNYSPYRLYRFLTDLEDILNNITNDVQRLSAIVPLVRKLINDSPWLVLSINEPNPDTGWEIMTLYDDPSYPLTVQLVSWAEGTISPIHNHGCWGVVTLLQGEEKNTFWRKNYQANQPFSIEKTEEKMLTAGDILCLTPSAIHHIEAKGNQPTISFNLYGETDYDNRWEFDIANHTAKNF